ncbi:hypothetical protein [Rhodophyticola porphyridii]|uniref:hypothetical protein n=1 Tax=Rhodophyticola porphyridii TaxID=1852017 RepID=UPI0035CFB375
MHRLLVASVVLAVSAGTVSAQSEIQLELTSPLGSLQELGVSVLIDLFPAGVESSSEIPPDRSVTEGFVYYVDRDQLRSAASLCFRVQNADYRVYLECIRPEEASFLQEAEILFERTVVPYETLLFNLRADAKSLIETPQDWSAVEAVFSDLFRAQGGMLHWSDLDLWAQAIDEYGSRGLIGNADVLILPLLVDEENSIAMQVAYNSSSFPAMMHRWLFSDAMEIDDSDSATGSPTAFVTRIRQIYREHLGIPPEVYAERFPAFELNEYYYQLLRAAVAMSLWDIERRGSENESVNLVSIFLGANNTYSTPIREYLDSCINHQTQNSKYAIACLAAFGELREHIPLSRLPEFEIENIISRMAGMLLCRSVPENTELLNARLQVQDLLTPIAQQTCQGDIACGVEASICFGTEE